MSRGLRRTGMRRLAGLAGLALVVGLVACGSPAEEAPPPTPDQVARITADAVTRACMEECAGSDLLVRDELITSETEVGEARPMPGATAAAIVEVLSGARLVGRNEADALFGEDGLVAGGSGVLVTVGPVEDLAPGVVGIEVGLSTARDGGSGRIFQYRWQEGEWAPATSDQTGITTVSWVS